MFIKGESWEGREPRHVAPVSLSQEDEDNVSQHSLSQPLLVCRGRAVLSLISPEERGTRRGQGEARVRKHQSNGHPHTLQQWENTAVYWSFFSAYTVLGVQHPHISACHLLAHTLPEAFRGPSRGFPGGPVLGNPSANARDTGSVPGLGRSHKPRGS